ncbi:MAG: ribonuclease G [Zoogloeaceae bacterium]|jgi:ribonuclease G|nr:ribonuclease G [Zoogloeaceae bacterium]
MTESILINFAPQETRVAILAQGVVQELHIERAASRGLVGNIYLGRVSRILPGMQSAFIDMGLERTAFLHVADIWQPRENGNGANGGNGEHGRESTRPIETMLSEGQSLMVQVIKDPLGSKGARLSTQISLAGRMLVYLPQEKHIGISQRIEDEAGRESLRARLAALVPPGEEGGFIVRTMAENASDEELESDMAYLGKLWRDIRERANSASAPSPLYLELDLAHRVLRDCVNPETSRIVIDSERKFRQLQEFVAEYTPAVSPLLEYYGNQRPLFDLYGVEEEMEKALARRVDLKSGGYLILDQNEAMTTIDVNTGGFVGVRNFDDTVFKTNLEAAQAIARQLRLRNLGGIIVIDFIDMENAEHRKAVLSEFNKALAGDHTRITVNGFTALGLVEMTRKRTRESLSHILCEPCPTCGGRGEVKTARTVAHEILRELLREARQFDAREYRVLAGPDIIDLLQEEESQALALLSDEIGKPVSLQAEASYAAEQYDIVLM